MSRESMYIEQYLDYDGYYTIGSFLHRVLRGAAKSYSGRYANALRRALERRIASGEVKTCLSCRNGLAYRRVFKES